MNAKVDLKTVAGINKEIDAIKVAGSKLDARIQTCAVAVLEHYSQHNDVTLINRLYNALSKGARKAAMTSWLLAYAAVVANTEADKKDNPFKYAKDKTTDALAASQDPWFDHKPDAAPDEVLDLQKAIKAIIARAAKAKELKHGDLSTVKALAAAVGIPESDCPAKLAD